MLLYGEWRSSGLVLLLMAAIITPVWYGIVRDQT
jgi:hypothetical protein